MGTPTTDPRGRTPETNKDRALEAVARASKKRAEAEANELQAMRIASACGASVRDIAAQTDVSYATVSRMLQRTDSE